MSDDRKKAFWFIALLSVLVILPFLGETIFYSKGEPREAIVAFSMLESGNWILPVNYGTDIAYKPPFFYWAIATVCIASGGSDGIFVPPAVCSCISGYAAGVFFFYSKA